MSLKNDIYIETDFIKSVGFSKLMIKKVSGNFFRTLFFYLINHLNIDEKYNKDIDAILIIKNGKDVHKRPQP